MGATSLPIYSVPAKKSSPSPSGTESSTSHTTRNEVEDDFNITWEDSGYDDAKELEVETCYDAEEEVSYHNAEAEDCDYYCYDY